MMIVIISMYKIIISKTRIVFTFLKERRTIANRLKCHDIAFVLLCEELCRDHS